MQKTVKQPTSPVIKQVPKYQPPDHLKDDIVWELFKMLLIAGLPTLLVFYTFEAFIPFGAQEESYRKRCDEAGGFVSFVNQEKMCIKKDGLIKIE